MSCSSDYSNLPSDYSSIDSQARQLAKQIVQGEQKVVQQGQEVEISKAVLADLQEENKAMKEKAAEAERTIKELKEDHTSDLIQQRLAARRAAKVASSVNNPQTIKVQH